MTTGELGIGKKVSKNTMVDFMERYGVPKARIDELLGFNICICKKATTKHCSKCKWKYYCSEECIHKDWPRHKHFCGIEVPEKRVKETPSQKSVYGVLLMPEKEAKPKFVEITLNLKVGDVDEKEGAHYTYWKPALDEYFHGQNCISPLQWGNGDQCEHRPTLMENTLQFFHHEEILKDGSKLNECVRKITGGMAANPWAGPILVLKAQKRDLSYGEDNYYYRDMKLADCDDMIEFFLHYDK